MAGWGLSSVLEHLADVYEACAKFLALKKKKIRINNGILLAFKK